MQQTFRKRVSALPLLPSPCDTSPGFSRLCSSHITFVFSCFVCSLQSLSELRFVTYDTYTCLRCGHNVLYIYASLQIGWFFTAFHPCKSLSLSVGIVGKGRVGLNGRNSCLVLQTLKHKNTIRCRQHNHILLVLNSCIGMWLHFNFLCQTQVWEYY